MHFVLHVFLLIYVNLMATVENSRSHDLCVARSLCMITATVYDKQQILKTESNSNKNLKIKIIVL